MKIRTHMPNTITKGRSPETDLVEQKMQELAKALYALPGWPMEGTHGPSPEHIYEVTILLETRRTGNHGEQRHPGTQMLFRWWPEHFVPPEAKVVIPYWNKPS